MKKLALLLFLMPSLSWPQGTVPFTPAVIFNGDTVRTLRSQIDINGIASLLTGTDNPSSVSKFAPQGSVYLRTGPSGGQLFLKQDAGNTTNWTQSGGGGGSGALSTTTTFASPLTVTGSGGISAPGNQRQLIYVKSVGGAVPITASPQITSGSTVGQELVIFGASATDYIILSDGSGISLNGPINLTDNAAIMLIWNGSSWAELSRR